MTVNEMEDALKDLLPEEFPLENDGCELWPHCLTCPFPYCIKEEPWGKEKWLKAGRARRMQELHREGKSTGDIARIFGVSARTVQRALKLVEEGKE
jgi:DNA-binding transcriptional ArsR family regulator